MGIFLMILMILMYAGQTMTCRAYSTNYPGEQSSASLTFLVICSVTAAIAANLLTIVLPLINRTVFFSVKNAGILTCNILGAAIFFKEKISLTNIIGAVFMCVGLVCISVF